MIIYITDIDKFDNEKSFLENIKLASFYGINFIPPIYTHVIMFGSNSVRPLLCCD